MGIQNQAEIISIGTELIRGESTDTNASYLASQLPLSGIEVHKITTVADDREQLCEILRKSLDRSSLVVAGGGLGPTEDDLTRECIATVLGETLYVDAELEKQLRELFNRMGIEMPPHNIKQAWLIPSAEPLVNPLGTAPGWWVNKGKRTIVALPGPPREMKLMWQNEVKPRLESRFPGKLILSRTIKTFALPEAKIAELVQPFFTTNNPSLGIYAKPDGIHLRLIAVGDNSDRLLRVAGEQLEEILGPSVWGKDDDTLEGVIGKLLNERGLTLATMEDGTSGLLANKITAALGSSEYYGGSLIACSEGMKIVWGVPKQLINTHGAISAEVAEAMAVVAKDRFSADIGLSTTGIVGARSPDGKPSGLTYIGITDTLGQRSWEHNYARFRDESGQREAIGALFRLRERLIELKVAQ
ncbi:CinA family nicotinamide mononucleotide deamidase-related protein [Chloroflexota bacterium]